MITNLWNKEEERKFFTKTLEIASPEQLFYLTKDGRYVFYWPRDYRGKKSTLQSRNAFIGSYTEKWIKDLLTPFARKRGLYAIHNVVCREIGLTRLSPADVALVKTPQQEQKPEDITLLVEVKMSIVWNWEYIPSTGKIICIGDYTTHQGTPGLLRSDSMLKAIGKSINIRVSGPYASGIPIIVIGNTPIKKSYYKKVDFLKKAGIIQGFYSLNPKPLDEDNQENIKRTPFEGFMRIDSLKELYKKLKNLVENKMFFFSSMLPKRELGKIIEEASKEPTDELKGEKFLKLLTEIKNEQAKKRYKNQ